MLKTVLSLALLASLAVGAISASTSPAPKAKTKASCCPTGPCCPNGPCCDK